jgi:hypothetical protein
VIVRAEPDFDEALGRGADLGAVDQDPAFGTDEGGAVIDDVGRIAGANR